VPTTCSPRWFQSATSTASTSVHRVEHNHPSYWLQSATLTICLSHQLRSIVPTTRSTRWLPVRCVHYTFATLTLVCYINYLQLNAAPDKAKCFSYNELITLLLMYTRHSGGFALKYTPYPCSGGFALKNIHLSTLGSFTIKICVYSRSGVLMKGYDSRQQTSHNENKKHLKSWGQAQVQALRLTLRGYWGLVLTAVPNMLA
jgi:hypothetical protein